MRTGQGACWRPQRDPGTDRRAQSDATRGGGEPARARADGSRVVAELQRTKHLPAGMVVAALLQAYVLVAAEPRQVCQLLAPEPRCATAPGIRGADILGMRLLAARSQVLTKNAGAGHGTTIRARDVAIVAHEHQARVRRASPGGLVRRGRAPYLGGGDIRPAHDHRTT